MRGSGSVEERGVGVHMLRRERTPAAVGGVFRDGGRRVWSEETCWAVTLSIRPEVDFTGLNFFGMDMGKEKKSPKRGLVVHKNKGK